jgi:hypothetical protein
MVQGSVWVWAVLICARLLCKIHTAHIWSILQGGARGEWVSRLPADVVAGGRLALDNNPVRRANRAHCHHKHALTPEAYTLDTYAYLTGTSVYSS